MRINEIMEDGVIVPGVNTTVDVQPGQTEKEAAKFFGKGKPAELHKKARKNSNAHILYNLGLTEADDDKEDLKGFDAKTQYALRALQAKYPHADNLMSALMAQTDDALKNQKAYDKKSEMQDKKHSQAFLDMEVRLFNLIKKNNLKETKNKL